MLVIELLGIGCTKCRNLEKTLEKTIDLLKIDATIKKIEDIETFLSYGITGTPALIINGEVASYGRDLSYEELEKLLSAYIEK